MKKYQYRDKKEQKKKQVAYEDNMCNARCIQSNGKI